MTRPKRLGPVRPSVRILDEAGALRPLAEIEVDIISNAVDHYGCSGAARALRIGRSTLHRKIPKQDRAS